LLYNFTLTQKGSLGALQATQNILCMMTYRKMPGYPS
jgi:hypothetical protein